MANTSATAAVIKAATASIVATASTSEVAAVVRVETFIEYCVRTDQTTTWATSVGFDYIVARKIPSKAVA